MGPQASDENVSYPITSLGYTLKSNRNFNYTTTEETGKTTVEFTKVSDNIVISGAHNEKDTILNVKTSGADDDFMSSDDETDPASMKGKRHSVVLDTDFEGSNFISFDVPNLDITKILPAAGKTVSIGQISNENATISIAPYAYDADKYIYRLYYETKGTNDTITKTTLNFTKPTIDGDYYKYVVESSSTGKVLNLSCIERNNPEIELDVTIAGSKYVTTADTGDATDINELLDDADSLTGITLTLPESSEEAETLEITDKSGLPAALTTAATKGIPVTLKLNSATSIEFPVEATTYTAPITFTAKRTEKTLDAFKDDKSNSYTYKGYAGEFSVIDGSNDITSKFTFTLNDLPDGLIEKKAGSTKFSVFSQIGDATNGVRPISTTPSAYGTPTFTSGNAIKFTPGNSSSGSIKDATWYLLDSELVIDHVYFDANVPETAKNALKKDTFNFNYEEDILADTENYPSVYEVSENKTTLVASIPQLANNADITIPSGNAVKLTKGNKPYTLYGWAKTKYILDEYASADNDWKYDTLKADGTKNNASKIIGSTGHNDTTFIDVTNDALAPKCVPTGAKDATYYAVWKPAAAKVTFDLNFEGATLDSFGYRNSNYVTDTEKNQLYVTFAPDVALENTNAKLLKPTEKIGSPSMKANAREGYTFVGWAPTADATEAEELYQFDFDYDYAGGTTYYAVWEKTSADEVTPATVTFDANGGEFTSTPSGYTKNDNVLTVEFATEDAADVAVPANSVLKRTGYKFLGWSSSKEGAADTTLTKVNYNTGTVTFYAVWEKTSEENPGTDDPGKEDPGKEDSGNNNETPSANTTPSVNYVEKTVAAATVDGKSVSVCYASKQLYQGRKLKNFDAIDYITVNGVSYNGSKVVVKVSKGKDAGSKVTFLIKKIKGESKEFNKALKAQKLTYTVEIIPVDVEKITTSKPATYEKPGTVYLKINKKGVAKAWLVTQKKADSTKRSLVRIKDGVSYDSSAKTATFTGTNVKGSAKVS